MRRDCPAASRIHAIFCVNAGIDGAFTARLRGMGRAAISPNNPPAAKSASSRRLSSMPASKRCNTQSKPFNFGERAHPGIPIIGIPCHSATISIFPGSTAKPSWLIWPPNSSIATGTTSCLSAIALPPQIRTSSAPDCRAACNSSLSASFICAHTAASIRRHPRSCKRLRVTARVASYTFSGSAAPRVWIR